MTSLPADLLALIEEGHRLSRLGLPTEARQAFERLDEAITARGLGYSQAFIQPLLLSASTATANGDFPSARETLRLCYGLASRLKQPARSRMTYEVQAAHLRWCTAAGDLATAVTLCGAALEIRSGPRGVPARTGYAIEAATVLRRLGLHDLSLSLLDALQAQTVAPADVGAIEMRVAIRLCRAHILAFRCGVSFQKQGPLGWEASDAQRAREALEMELEALGDAAQRADEVGSLGYARAGRQACTAYHPSLTRRPDALLEYVAERARSTRTRGIRCEEQECLIDLAGMQIENGLHHSAATTLEQAAGLGPIERGPVAVAERWHWFRHLVQRHHGQAEKSMASYVDYTRAVDLRTELSRRFLADHLHHGRLARPNDSANSVKRERRVAKVALQAMSFSDDPAGFDERLAELCRSTQTPAELAARMGVSMRRLQQLFSSWGLPSPARYLRELKRMQ